MIAPRQPTILSHTTTDDYGNTWTLVDKCLLDDAHDRITELQAAKDNLTSRLIEAADALTFACPPGTQLGARGVPGAIDRLRAERDAAQTALQRLRDEAVEVMNSGGMSARELAEKVIYLIADNGGCR